MPPSLVGFPAARRAHRRWTAGLLPALCLGTLCVVIALATPPHMDEFLVYEPFYCWFFPFQRYAGCGRWDLLAFGRFLPLRTWDYIGIGSALRYLPVYLAWPGYLSARLLALASLGVSMMVLVRWIGLRPWMAAILVGANFPFVFIQTVDTGPCAFHCAALTLLPALCSGSASFRKSAAFAALLFLSVEHKLSIGLALPGLGVLCAGIVLAESSTGWKLLSKTLRLLGATAAAAGAGWWLLSLRTKWGASYWDDAFRFSTHLPLSAIGAQAARFTDRYGPYLMDLRNFSNRIYEDERGLRPLSVAYWAITVWLVWGGLFGRGGPDERREQKRRRSIARFSLAAFLVTLWCLNLSDNAIWAHHLVLAWPFLLLAVAAGAVQRAARAPSATKALLVAFGIVGVAMTMSALNRPPREADDWSKIRLMKYLSDPDLSRRYVYVSIDWGVHYIQAIYGDRGQSLLFYSAFGPREADDVRNVSASLGRKVLFIAREPNRTNNVAEARTFYPDLVREQFGDGAPGELGNKWVVWREP